MIESLRDFMSIAVMAVITLIGFYLLYQVFAKHHEENMKKLEENYYRFYDEADDAYDDDFENIGSFDE